eukprot:824588-Rhodomonas_salina.1
MQQAPLIVLMLWQRPLMHSRVVDLLFFAVLAVALLTSASGQSQILMQTCVVCSFFLAEGTSFLQRMGNCVADCEVDTLVLQSKGIWGLHSGVFAQQQYVVTFDLNSERD